MSLKNYRFTYYFETTVLKRRPYLMKEWCIYTIENAEYSEPQELNRFRYWAQIPELENRYLRVVTLADLTTIHNAFPDRGFKK